ncbi:MAG: glycosyltransferase [Vampirovibrionia bacterium]
MSLRILILDAYNNNIIKYFVNKNKDKMPTYTEGNKLFLDSGYFMAGYYSKYFNKYGHNACELIANCVYLQDLWIKEHSFDFEIYSDGWFYKLLELQIKDYKPDVVYCRHVSYFDTSFLQQINKYTSLLVGQSGSYIPDNYDLSVFDFIITPLLPYIERFKELGTSGEIVHFAFDKDIISKIQLQKEKTNISFVGCLGKDKDGVSHFDQSTDMFEQVANNIDIHFWGPAFLYDNFDKNSSIMKNYKGEAWGMDMYNILANSNITLNRHAGLAGDYALNIRLFEATGAGTFLLTDEKSNLKDFFTPDEELVTYSNPKDLIDKSKYYLKHDDERLEIAQAGQKRTLECYNYDIRIKEIIDLFYKYL